MRAGILDGVNHPLDAALAESARNQDSVRVPQAQCRRLTRIQLLGFDLSEELRHLDRGERLAAAEALLHACQVAPYGQSDERPLPGIHLPNDVPRV